uniref:LIM zinc-binding domain-containing protein n=1 Tax=Schistosoma mansoni TaxID=6183 RepID=A0A5K4ES81_SCHMA
MDSYNEHDDQRELEIIIHKQENQHDGSDTQCKPELVSSITAHHNIANKQTEDDEIVFKNVKLINSTDNKSHSPIDSENDTAGVTQCDDEYDTLDELFDIAKLLTYSMDNRQSVSAGKIHLKADDDGYEPNAEKAFVNNNNSGGGDDDDIKYQPSQTTDNNLISSRNVEIKQIVIGYPDRMSIVMEENDEDYASEASINQENCHKCSEILMDELSSDRQDMSKDPSQEQITEFVDNPNKCVRMESRSSSTSDVTTIDENDIACEIEIHPQPLDHWVEDSYATVVRHTPVITPTTVTPVNTANHNTEMDNLIQENLEVYNPHEEYAKKQFDSKLGIGYNYYNKAVEIEEFEDLNNGTNHQLPSETRLRTIPLERFITEEQHINVENLKHQSQPMRNYCDSESLVKMNIVSDDNLEDRTRWRTCPSLILPTRESIEQPRCHACAEVVYPLEALQTIGRVYHKTCFKCHQCHRVLSLGKYSVWEGNPYCEPHYLVLFKAFGQYNSSLTKTPILDASSHVQQEVSRIERSTSNVTQTLVAKFQELESGNNATSIQNSLPQNQPPHRIYFNSTHTGPTSANGDVFPSSGRARQLVERWNKMPLENQQTVGRVASEINGKPHVLNQRKFIPVEPKASARKPVEQKPKQLVSELKQNFSHKPEDEAYCSSESTECAKIGQYHSTNGKTSEFPTPGITRNLVAKFSALSAAS